MTKGWPPAMRTWAKKFIGNCLVTRAQEYFLGSSKGLVRTKISGLGTCGVLGSYNEAFQASCFGSLLESKWRYLKSSFSPVLSNVNT